MLAMAIWAHQYSSHEHMSPSCGKIYFDYGRSFGLCIVGWLLCFFNLILRGINRSSFEEGRPTPYSASLTDTEPYKAM